MAGNRVISAVLTLKDKDFGSTAKKSASAMSDFERKVKHSGNTVSKFGKSAVSSFKSVALGATSIVTAIGVVKGLSMALGMVKSSISSAFDRIDVMENFQRTMTVMTGSTEKAKVALEATRNAVTGTAYGLDVAAKSVQDFVTRGMEVEKATAAVGIWGDAVAFYGKGSSEQLATVSDALGKMYSSGKVGADQLNSLFDAGIDGVGMYAKATGKSEAVVSKALSKGSISAESFIDVVSEAMREGTNGVQKIAGAAKEAGASWSGTFANMRAAVTRGVENIIMKTDEMLVAKGLPNMRTMVAQFGSKFESVLKSAGDKVPLLMNSIVGLYEGAKPGLDWLKDTALPAVKDELVAMYEASQPGLAWLKDVAFPGIVDAVVLATEGFTGMYNFVKDNLPLITPVVAGVAASILAFKIGVSAVATATAIWKGVTATATIALGLLNGTLALTPLGWIVIAIGAVVAAGVALYMNWDIVKEKTSQLWSALLDNPLYALVLGPFGAIIAAGITLYNNFDKIKNAFNLFKAAISNFALPAWVNTIGSTLSNAASAVKGVFSGGKPTASYAVGTNRVTHDQVANIHKDEMIIPARQSQNLRNQGVTIDNVDKPRTANVSTSNSSKSSNVFNININARDKSATDIVNELIPMLKLRLANL